MRNYMFFSLFLLAFWGNAFGQTDPYWIKVPGPSGGQLEIIKTDVDILYGRGYDELYRSDNAGLNWNKIQVLFNNQPRQDEISIGQSGRFYLMDSIAAGNNRLFTSLDGGANWQLIQDSLNLPRLVKMEETPGGALLARSDSSLYRSADGGVSWLSVLTGSDLYYYSQFTSIYPGELVLTSGQSAVYHSNDDGQSWMLLARPAGLNSNYPVNPGLFISNAGTYFWLNDDRIARSTNEGQQWDLSDYMSINTMYMLPGGRILGVDGSEERVYYSDDDGLTWNLLATEWNIKALSSTPQLSDGTIFGYALQSLYRSNDGGISWQFSSFGIDYANVQQLKFFTNDTVFATTPSGFWRSFDAGLNWSKLIDNKKSYSDISRVISVGTNGQLLVGRDDSLLWSTNFGASFINITPPGGVTGYGQISPNDSLLFVNGQSGIYRSDNYGSSWQPVLDQYFYSLNVHPSGRYFLLSGTPYNNFLISDNKGLSWQTVTLPFNERAYTVFIDHTGDIYLNCSDFSSTHKKLRSTDNGAHWTFAPLGTQVVGRKYFETAEEHLLSFEADETVYRSIDQGLHWNALPDVRDFMPYTVYFGLGDMDLSPDQFMYIGTHGYGIMRSNSAVNVGAYIEGDLRRDADDDCSTPDAQEPLKNWVVTADGIQDYYTTSDENGHYRMFVDTGMYQVTTKVPQYLWWSLCDSVQTALVNLILQTDTIDFVGIGEALCPLMTVDVTMPGLRRCFDNTVAINYCNQGTETADSAWIDLTIDPYLSLVNCPFPYNDLGNNTFRVFVGNVDPLFCNTFYIRVHVDCDSTVLGQTHCILAHAFPDTLCTPVPNWSGANIEATVQCQDSTVQFSLRNTGSVPSQPLKYIIIEDDVVMLQGQKAYDVNENLNLNVTADGHTWRIESMQEPGHPFSTHAIAFEEGCGGFNTLGFINQFSVDGWTPSIDQECVENSGSYDPNDKQGFPLGYGTQHNIEQNQEMKYLIRFQNTGTDTAFTVVVRDTLSVLLDPSSVQPGPASHPYTWTLSGNGVLSFRFDNILLTDSSTNLEGSQGFISFRIRQQPDLEPGTQIFNSADIYFDFNEPIVTNQTWHTIASPLVATQTASPKKQANNISVSPNPVLNYTTLRRYDGLPFKNSLLVVRDALGHIVHQSVLNGMQQRFNREDLPAGVYFYTVETPDRKLIGSGKMMLE